MIAVPLLSMFIAFIVVLFTTFDGMFEEDAGSLTIALFCTLYIGSTIFTMIATQDVILNYQFDCITNNNIMTCVEKPEKKEKE